MPLLVWADGGLTEETEGEGFSTVKEYVFIVGDTAPQITLPEDLAK